MKAYLVLAVEAEPAASMGGDDSPPIPWWKDSAALELDEGDPKQRGD